MGSSFIEGKSQVRLWGVDNRGKPVLIIDDRLRPMFYLIPKSSPQQCLLESVTRELQELDPSGTVAVAEKKYLGREISAIRVEVSDPSRVSKIASKLAKTKGIERSLEEDVRLANRYLINKQIAPSRWYEGEGVPDKDPGSGFRTLRITSDLSQIGRTEPPQLKVLAFNVIAIAKKGSPKPARDPVHIIAVSTNTRKNEVFTMERNDDRRLLEDFVNFVKAFDPDAVVGFGCNRFDWPYLVERAKLRSVDLHVDRELSGPHTSMFGHVSIAGRANIDLLDFAGDMTEIKLKTIENLTAFLGITDLDRQNIDETDYSKLWADQKTRGQLIAYASATANAMVKVADKSLAYLVQLSSITGLPLDQVVAAAVGFRVESYLVIEASKLGELIPPRSEQPYFPYRGAVVLEPRIGITENVAVLDFASMYPNVIILNNISPDTLVKERSSGAVTTIPDVGHKFLKKPDGFYKIILKNLISERAKTKSLLKKSLEGSIEWRILSERERALKLVANACYGYTAWVGARWYVREIAEAAAALGRVTMKQVVDKAQALGLEVVYGDTDAIFVKNEPGKIRKLTEWVEASLEMEIKPDKIYERVLFTEAKKRYAGLLPDGTVDIVGLEVVRGDWSDIAKNVQECVVEFVLKDKRPDRAVEFTRSSIRELRGGKVPTRELTIWKTLSKPIEQYEVRAPHVEVAKQLVKQGWEISVGDKIGYVITRTKGKLFEKARAHSMVSPDEIDAEYYVTNQVMPAALRILEMFGVKESDLSPA